MKSILSVVVLSLFFVSCTKTEKQDVPYNDISFYKNVDESHFKASTVPSAVVKINVGGGVGTGVFVSHDGLMLTNDHVVGSENCFKEGCYIDLDFYYQKGGVVDSKTVYAEPLHGDSGADITVFQIYSTYKNTNDEYVKSDSKLQTSVYLKMTSQSPSAFVGQELYTIGHPAGALKKVTKIEILSTNGHDFWVQGAVIGGQSGSPVVTENGELIGLAKTSTVNFTHVANKGLNVQGGVVSISELEPYFQQNGGLFYAKSGVTPKTEEFASIEDEYVNASWIDYYSRFRAIKKMPKGLSLSDENSPVITELEKRCEGFIDSIDDGVISHSESQTEYSFNDCSRLVGMARCKNYSSTTAYSDQYICPSADQKKKWSKWILDIFEKQAIHNGEVSLYVLNMAHGLDDSIVVSDEYYRILNSVRPTLTLEVLETILSFKMNSYESLDYEGIDLKGKFQNFKNDPNYYLYTNDILLALSKLYNRGYTSVHPVRTAKGLLRDSKVSLSDRWRIESTLYIWDAL